MDWQTIRTDAKRIEKSGYVRTDGGIVIKSEYSDQFVAAIKALPKADRQWDTDGAWNKFWFVGDNSADAAIALWEKYFGTAKLAASPKAQAQPERTIRTKICPDCGHSMDYDGTWYCEHCEG